MRPTHQKRIVFITFLVGVAALMAPRFAHGANVYVTRFWHNHQPIYWPEWNSSPQNERVQYAWDSISLKSGQVYDSGVSHPENDLNDIFGKSDRVNAYQGTPRDSLSTLASPAGYAMSYSGSLIDNVRNLGANNQLGYGSGWWGGNREARGWYTPSGSRRMDLVGFPYHHSMSPVLPKSVIRKEIDIFKQAYWKAWNGNSDLSDHSKGFFPTEMAFSSGMIDVLVDEGYQWVIVASHHLSRTCPTYFNYANPTGTFQIKSSPPNRADLLGPSPTAGWWFAEPNPGNAAWNVSPFAYQLQKVKYVNPTTGAEKTMIAVPSDDVESYVAGYSGAQIGLISQNISPYANDPSRPALVMPASDGDNAWGGGNSSWFESTPAFFNACQSAGYGLASIQDFVNQFGPAAPVTHIEDGAWIFPESDYGSPYFLKWVEPPIKTTTATNTYPNTIVDLETPGFALKFWSWAPLMAGANWCETAEQIYKAENVTNSVQAWKIQAPYDWDGSYTSPNVVERAWHIYLCGLDSGFNYYGGLGNDDEVKPSLATRRAIEMLQSYMSTRTNSDQTPPTVFKPQRFPWNPGAYTFGWFNRIPGGDERYLKKMPSEFYVWTHAYDLSGVSSVTLKLRMDNDGVNVLANNDNETYAGGGDVGSWISIPMTKRVLPNTTSALNAAANNGQINYFSQALSPFIADYYFAKIDQVSIPGFRGKLLDYYIEAVDTRNNTSRTDIQHVFVENDGATVPLSSDVAFSGDPRNCAPLTVTYKANQGPLSNSVPVRMQISFTQGTSWTPYTMIYEGGGTSTYTVATVPDAALSAIVWFESTNDAIVDSRNSANWSTSIRDCNSWTSQAWIVPANPDGCNPVTIWYSIGSGVLQTATQIYIHVGCNGWRSVPPDAVMTYHWEIGHSGWYYVYTPEAGTYQIDVAFNDGSGTWDNNNGNDWHFAVSNCVPPTVPLGIVITNPAADIISVSNEVTTLNVAGTAGTNITGNLSWSNSLTGGHDSLLKNPVWTVSAVPLGVGTNFIVMRGLVSEAVDIADAQDHATNSVYNPTWDNGDNGGSGFGPWQLGANAPAGHFRATLAGNTNLNIGSVAWGLWANNGGWAEAIRPFSSPLVTGQTIKVEFENNWINTGGSAGVALQNASGESLFQFIFFGGQTNYTIYDSVDGRNSGILYTDSGLALAFELTTTSTYRFVAGSATITGQLAAAANQTVSRFRVYNYQTGSGGNYDVFINDLRVIHPSIPVYSNDSVLIVRQQPLYHDGIPLSWWDRYGLGTNSSSIANLDSDRFNNIEEYICDTDPTNETSYFHIDASAFAVWFDSSSGRHYTLQGRSNLMDGIWTDVPGGGPRAGVGGTDSMQDTNEPSKGSFYRLKVSLP